VGNQNGIAISLHNLGMAARYEGNLDQAIPYCEEALALYRELGSSWGIATALHTLGCAKLDLGEEMQAEALLEASLQLQEALGNRRNLAWTWLSLAELALQRKEWETARQRQRQALAVFRSLGSRRGTIAALNSLAYTAMEMNDAARAVRLFAFTDSVEREHRPCYAESEVRQRAHTLTALQAHLGARDFARAQMEGRLLTWNEAVEQAGNV
jgi:tetratricopeptide (TPR) repeat protein